MLNNGHRFRLAVAFTALKFKPPQQSFLRYVLDLRDRFATSHVQDLAALDSWRILALKLEHDLALLTEKYEAEQISKPGNLLPLSYLFSETLPELLALENGTSLSSSFPGPNSSLEQISVSKKKSKKKNVQPPSSECEISTRSGRTSKCPELRTILEDLSSQNQAGLMPGLPGSDSLFANIDNFFRLLASSQPRQDLLLSTTLRVVNALANQINDIIAPLNLNSVTNPDMILLRLRHILYHVLSESLVLLEKDSSSQKTVIVLFDDITRLILVPMIRGFGSQSTLYLSSLFLHAPDDSSDGILQPSRAGRLRRVTPLDMRVSMLDLFKDVFSVLNKSSGWLNNISLASTTFRASLILEVVREIGRLLSDSSMLPTSNGADNNGNHRRLLCVKRLARKDALWYLSMIAHILYGDSTCHMQPITSLTIQKIPTGPPETRRGPEILNEAISATLLKLISRSKRPPSAYACTPPAVESQFPGPSATRQGEEKGSTGQPPYSRETGHAIADTNSNAAGQCEDEDATITNSVPSRSKVDGSSRHTETYELDEAEYNMLLGVLEGYWVWCNLWDP